MSAAALILPQALDSLSIKGLNVPLALVIYTQLAIINVAFVELLGIVAPGGQAQAQAMPPTQAAVARNAGERRNLQVRGRAGQRPRSSGAAQKTATSGDCASRNRRETSSLKLEA